MACKGCRRNAQSRSGLDAMLSRAASGVKRPSAIQAKTVNNYIQRKHIANVSSPRITSTGYVVTCLLCNTDSKPTPVPDTVLLNCNCRGTTK